MAYGKSNDCYTNLKTILYIISILVRAFVFIILVLFTAPIWGLLQLISTIIVLKICWGKSKRYKEIHNKFNELDERIKKLESEKIVDNIISKTENREGR